ncbi:MAG: PH domain-containing protein [Acidimicrobiales bacterium]
MAFSRRLLAPGEEIVLEAHPNWSILAPRVGALLICVAASLALASQWTGAPLWFGFVLLGIVALVMLFALAKVVSWRSTSLVLTNMRVVYRTGVLRRLGREIPLGRVQDVTYTQSIFERLVGAGSLTVESAGTSGQEPFRDIAKPAAVQSLINRLIAGSAPRYDTAGAARLPPVPPPSPPQRTARRGGEPRPAEVAPSARLSSSAELNRLRELLDLGVITEAEYRAKRSELVERDRWPS